MAGSLRRVRVGLVVVAVLLVAVLMAYVGYARRQALRAFHDLPRKLGIDITQETDNFTYSQSLKGKTVFTIHASKELEHRNGVITLHEVSILLYGATGTRRDHIQGQEFEYDQKNGILRAVGEALIDLGPPGDRAADEAQMIHVKTSGLVFRKEDATAKTDEAIQFTRKGLTGEAVGASYHSNTSVLVLQSAVNLRGQRGARPYELTAGRAELDRTQNVLLLDGPKYVLSSDAGPQTMSASQAVIHTSADGKPMDVEARGNVQLAGQGRGSVFAERLEVKLADDGQPRDGHLYDGVRFVNETAARQEQGRAQDLRVAFDEGGKARRALLNGAVQIDDTAGASSRRIEADRLDLALSGGGKAKLVLRGAVATGAGGARVRIVDKGVKGTTVTGVRADTLTGRFGALGLTGLDGAGKTYLERVESNTAGQQRIKETSTGDTLAIELKPAGVDAKSRARLQLAHAVQKGSVEVVREAAAKKPGAPAEVEHAHAAAGDYDADRDQLTLTGGAAVSDAVSAVFADKVQLQRATGEATAEGAVRVSYAQGKSNAEPVHVLATRAVFQKASGITHFTGTMVRMWQAGSQVEAPVIDLDRTKQSLTAYGDGSADAVHATLARQPGKAGAKASAPVTILSRRMTYTDAVRQIDFAGDVQVKEQTGTLRAQDALVYLVPAVSAAVTEPAENLFGGKLERVVATGDVTLQEPGRKASGGRIVYTTADETYVLTGTKAVPPRLDDETRGSVTGAQLRFKRGDESVEVVGGEGGRVRSEPRARQ